LLIQDLTAQSAPIDSKDPDAIPPPTFVSHHDLFARVDTQTGAKVIQERACNGEDSVLDLVGGNEENRHAVRREA